MTVIPELVRCGSTVIEDATTKSDLMCKLAGFAQAEMTFDVVVAVGHSNADGIRVASDLFMSWAAFARLLKPFKPRRLLLVACQAGNADVGETLFCSLPELRRVYASPVNASKNFGTAMMLAIPYVLSERRPKDRYVRAFQALSIAWTGTQPREWRRTTDKGNPAAPLFDLLAIAADPVVRAVPRFLRFGR